ncbi:MAG: RecX family transcriptional regulator [Pyrinomonadaceae bacterium]|nr:RecX family transcriptional regulator [Pyrinomonadaceae bacterium]
MWKKRIEIKPDAERVIKDTERASRQTFDRAVNLLGYKPRSVVELRTRLMEKEWTNSAIVEEVIQKLEGYGYLNDGQFAKDFAASQLRGKPIGKRVLQQKLAMKKLDKETVAAAIEATFEETPEAEVIERAIAKRLRLKGKPETREDTKKFYDYLLRQGFSYDLVSSKMRELNSREFDEEN